MAETNIEWADFTFNPWLGCTKVSPACKNCYAERDFDHRYGKVKWGPNGTRVLTSDANWRKPLKWNEEAANCGVVCRAARLTGIICPNDSCDIEDDIRTAYRPRVFCASLADVFEDWDGQVCDHNGNPLWQCEGMDVWQAQCLPSHSDVIMLEQGCRRVKLADVRKRLFKLIEATPNLDWLLLTKRPENIPRMWAEMADRGWMDDPRPNVWLGTSVENQRRADERIPLLLQCRELAPVLFLSCEPLLGSIEFSNVANRSDCVSQLGRKALDGIDWVIGGGESGPNSRPSHPDWFRSIRDQCKNTETAFLFKQWGEFAPERLATKEDFVDARKKLIVCHNGSVTSGLLDYGDDAYLMHRVGKKKAGRLLDGVTHDEFPKVRNHVD